MGPGRSRRTRSATRRLEIELDALDEWGCTIDSRPLHAEHGIARSDPTLDAIVISPETVGEVAAINEQRRDRQLDPLGAIVVPFVVAENGERISSTRVVAGEIDELGRRLENGNG